MTSKVFPDGDALPRARKSSARLAEMLKDEVSVTLIVNEIALLVGILRFLYGAEKIDGAIADQIKAHEAIEAGICWLCKKNQVATPGSICGECERKAEEELSKMF